MRVIVDPIACEANAVCVGIAPEVFDLDDEDVLHILVPEPPPELEERVRQAVDGCPKLALSLAPSPDQQG
jgi:ferredoxin